MPTNDQPAIDSADDAVLSVEDFTDVIHWLRSGALSYPGVWALKIETDANGYIQARIEPAGAKETNQ